MSSASVDTPTLSLRSSLFTWALLGAALLQGVGSGSGLVYFSGTGFVNVTIPSSECFSTFSDSVVSSVADANLLSDCTNATQTIEAWLAAALPEATHTLSQSVFESYIRFIGYLATAATFTSVLLIGVTSFEEWSIRSSEVATGTPPQLTAVDYMNLALVFTIVAIHCSLIVLQFTETALVSVLVSQEESCALEAHTLAPILGSAIAVLAGIAQGLLILLTHDL